MIELEKLEAANEKLVNQIRSKHEEFSYLVEAHEKLQNSLKLKEKQWDAEKYDRDLKEKNLEHMYESLKTEKVKVEEQLKLKISQLSQLEENFQMLKNTLHVKQKEWHVEKLDYLGEISILERKLDSEMEEKVTVNEQLRLKTSQLGILEENFQLLINTRHVKEKEWKVEKLDYLGEISMLERKLDSEITPLKDVKKRLECCKQALACEENQRICLQSQLLESKSCNKDIKSKLERLTIEKDGVCKEMTCKILQIEEENKELVLAVKKLKDSQFQEAVNSYKITELLQNKFNTLDEIYKGKEAEWTSRLDKLMEEELLLHDQLVQTKSLLKNACELLDTAKEEIVKSSSRVNEVEFELQRWKSFAEKLEAEKAWVTNEKGQTINKLLTEKEELINMIDDMLQWIDKLAREERQMMGALRSSAPDFDEN
uniref:uncharacterized protein At4g38062-like n=1 Tax=Erigeron canadensis TaxID=72917 RepID=UPI001CB96F7C|nr:uncharacterized protein At4g38062-like [Erigeron canadensis]